jgi:hypothetical protein
MSYHMMKPYLIRLHMTIDGWRPNRDKEGWRLPDSSSNTVLIKDDDGGGWNSVSTDLTAPQYMEAVPRFGSDLEALAGCAKHKPHLFGQLGATRAARFFTALPMHLGRPLAVVLRFRTKSATSMGSGLLRSQRRKPRTGESLESF